MNIEQEIQKILDRNFTRGDNANALNELLVLYNVVGRSGQLKALEKLKDFAYEVCPLHREDDLEEIIGSL